MSGLPPEIQADLSGWGRFPRAEALTLRPATRLEAVATVSAKTSLIARGLGRSYGDSSLNPAGTLLTAKMDRIISFEPDTGLLVCEGGLTLTDLLTVFSTRGWFPPVTPGTAFVTVGGMIASDVHGKNHHGAGSFGNHVEWLMLALADGSVTRCSPTEQPELFWATVGGMGLTGVILAAAFRLMRVETPWIVQRTRHARHLDEAITLLEDASASAYSVGWIDCLARGKALGRSVIFDGDHASVAYFDGHVPQARPKGKRAVPFDFPGFALNRLSVKAFNMAYYHAQRGGTRAVHFDPFFYPLDAIHQWNRIYGARGFCQYQCVLPKSAEGRAALVEILERIAASGQASFLAVLKLLGPGNPGMLSFPMEGYTLALDFPARAETLAMLDGFDARVARAGGRVYLTKDARMKAEWMPAFYPRLEEFRAIRRAVDPQARFSSLQSGRLQL